jgi:hypothetical protein
MVDRRVCFVEITMRGDQGRRTDTKHRRKRRAEGCADAALGAGRWNCRKLSTAFYFREIQCPQGALGLAAAGLVQGLRTKQRAVPGSMPNSAKRDAGPQANAAIIRIPTVSRLPFSSCPRVDPAGHPVAVRSRRVMPQ